jgi:hypothetical protein
MAAQLDFLLTAMGRLGLTGGDGGSGCGGGGD